MKQHIAIAEAHGIHQQPIAHIAAIHKPKLLVRRTARGGRQSEPPTHPDGPCGMLEGQRLLQEIVANDGAHPRLDRLQCRIDGRRIERHPLAIAQSKTDIRAGQRKPLDQSHDMTGFRGIAAHKLAPCRHIEEKIAHFDRGADHVRGRPHGRARTAFGLDLHGVFGRSRTGQQPQPRHRCNRGHRLATKS